MAVESLVRPKTSDTPQTTDLAQTQSDWAQARQLREARRRALLNYAPPRDWITIEREARKRHADKQVAVGIFGHQLAVTVNDGEVEERYDSTGRLRYHQIRGRSILERRFNDNGYLFQEVMRRPDAESFVRTYDYTRGSDGRTILSRVGTQMFDVDARFRRMADVGNPKVEVLIDPATLQSGGGA